MTRPRILASLLGLVAPWIAAASVAQQTNIPLNFEPNRGQAAAPAKFVARGTGYYLTLENAGSRMILRQGGKAADVHMRLTAANPTALMNGEGALPGRSSYFRGADASKWITDLPNFATVKAQGVYPGIDLVYYGNQKKLEYDFVVAPGANPGRISMSFDGVSKLRINPAGDLVLGTAVGEIVENKPVVYQNIAGVRQLVAGEFRLSGANQVSFHVGPYDHSSALVIDPVMVYSSFLGGTDDDYGNAVAADANGNMYMTGVTYSTSAGDGDVLLRKISADGTAFLYVDDLGGSDDDIGNGIAVDVNGYAFVAGFTASTDFPTANAYQNQNYGSNNAFLLRINPAGNAMVFGTYLGGQNDDRGYAVTVDTQGSAYLTGFTTSNDYPTSTGAFQRTRQGGADAFVAKFGYDGTAIYSTFLGGGSNDAAYAIAVDASGNAYVTGETYSDSFPQANAPYQHSRHGGQEGFVSELRSDGSGLIFSTFIGGSGDDVGNGIALDPSGNIYVVGTTTSDSNFSIPNRSYNTSYNGGASDIFVAKYLPAGQNIAWTTFLGTHGTDDGNAIAVDAMGNVYIAGDTNSDQYPVTKDALQSGRGGGYDAVLSVLDTNGQNLNYSTFYGGNGDDSASAVAVDAFNQVYLTGSTASGNLVISTGAVQGAPGGGNADAFLSKISVYGSAIPGASASVNPAPITTSVSTPMPVASVFGRTMTAGKTGVFATRKTVPEKSGSSIQRLSHRSRRSFASESNEASAQ